MQKSVYILWIFVLVFTMGTGCTASGNDKDASNLYPIEEIDLESVYYYDFTVKHDSTKWDVYFEMPDDECVKLRVDYPGGTLKELFRDSNHLHYAAAEKLGIVPLDSVSSETPVRRPLLRVESNELYVVDRLHHSYPLLVPEGKALLTEIAQRFHDTLSARGGGPYRLKVTSLLRTRESVNRLQRVNRASVDSSAHLFGTTFDISFTFFPYSGGTPHRTQEDMKNLLAEILHDLRNDNRCYIIYEPKRGCFHITVRPEEYKSEE